MRSLSVLVLLLALLPASSALAGDVAGDVFAARAAKLRKTLPKGFRVDVERPFVVISDGPERARKRGLRTVRWATEHLKKDFFPKDPRVLEVYLFHGERSYRKHAKAFFGDEPDTPYGYYSSDDDALVMNIATGGGTLVHELVHALTDQHFSFDTVYRTMFEEDRFDEVGAYQALIEGDATLAELMWLQTLSQRELGQFVAESLEIDSSSLDAAPLFIRDSLIFPYDTGLTFVQELYGFGQWQAVNDAYADMPDLPIAHGYLGLALMEQGDLDEALVELRACHELGAGSRMWSHPSEEWIAECERRIEERDAHP